MRQPNYPSSQGDSLDEPSYDTDDIAEQELCEYDAEYLYHKNACRHQKQLEAVRRQQYQREYFDQIDSERAKQRRRRGIVVGISVAIAGQLLLSSPFSCSAPSNNYRAEESTTSQSP
ncbi:hypothetical protein [Candidatus Nanoperiomorbus periodonticus]|uniref:hypothetical protein n=1 Tax=Candidatus Nanoperiomorbus periodonticus TaxID=2171989 RepID=UPI00101C4081|nr:hypothetical protein [Candidatus Nanoperiomorbus periodonticus]RYC75535.1 hypothetical protein G52EAM_00431 [Candidatus Nanoperiomorbus periodonticus]